VKSSNPKIKSVSVETQHKFGCVFVCLGRYWFNYCAVNNTMGLHLLK